MPKGFFHKMFGNKEQAHKSSVHSAINDGLSQDLYHSFNDLHLSDRRHNFIGGFNPNVLVTPSSPVVSPPGRPMPTPDLHIPTKSNQAAQSLTMQMALRPEGLNVRPVSEPVYQTHGKDPSSEPVYTPAIPLPETSDTVSSRPVRKRATSQPASSRAQTSNSGRQQCAGITKAGKQCTRQVKLQSQHTKNDTYHSEVFCFQHLKEVMGPSGFYSRKDGAWINFADWIPCYLQVETQAALRAEMEKARSSSDVPGYIYTFEIRDPDRSETIKLKVGRAVNLVKRIDQWGKQCGSKEQVLRGYYPGPSGSEDGGSSSLMKGRLQAGKAGPWCHRLERLIHIELRDLVASSVYLQPTWPKINQETSPSSPSGTISTSGPSELELCADCGSFHKEIFEFKRLSGRLKGQEWEAIVQPAIQRWGRFVDQCV